MGAAGGTGVSGLRVVAYHVLPLAYRLVADWAARGGHTLLLVVTTPGPPARRSATYREIIAQAPPRQEILVTTRMQRPVPLIRELAPDLVLSFSFPYLIPPEVTAIPKYGAVNLHPAPLPAYRGPNPPRLIYDGAPELGATLHRTAQGFDTGAIFSRHTAPLPEDVTPANVVAAWFPTMAAVLEEGVARAVAGEPGLPQDESLASYGGAFTDEEKVLDWSLTARLLQCRTTAVNLFGPETRATVAGRSYIVQSIKRLPGVVAPAPPGTLLSTAGNALVVCAGDGVVQVEVAEG